MPEPGKNILNFTGTHLQHHTAFTIYADFESLLVPIDTTSPSTSSSYIEKTAKHETCGYAYVIVGLDGKCLKPVQVYRGEDAVEHFLNKMIEEKNILKSQLLTNIPMHLSPEEERQFQEATECSICRKPLTTTRTRDHCHLTGQFRGAAHVHCNLNFKQSKNIPIFFHNLKHYDAHHIMTKLGKFKDHEIEVVATTMEKYVSFRLREKNSSIQLVFLDSFQFLPTSLEKLVQNLNDFKILKAHFPHHFNLLTRKGVYPYEYISSFQKFNETQLPPPSAFYNSLVEECISAADYDHAQLVWQTFKLNSLGEYHDLYVKTDVLLLADVFENFRTLSEQYYQIDPTHLFTSPGVAWQACLKMTDVQLELLTDIDMLLFFEKGTRGGISVISQRFAKANNPSIPDFDPQNPNSYILYLDANNLYGISMVQNLPLSEFEWCPVDATMTEDWILQLQDDAEYGYVFEVDLDYPEHLHNHHNDYPVAPERLTITEDMLSPHAKSMLNNRKFKGTPKLIPNLMAKKNYITHYRNLKFYLQLGLKLAAIHRVIKFKQSPWLKPYINFNTEKRKQAQSTFEKDFFKLLNNSVYGKTMENLRKRRNITLTNTERRAKKLVASPAFSAFKIFDEELTAVERLKNSILMNRPVYVGFAILELSKLIMYQFHYNFIKTLYNNNAKLLFTDTDSLTYHITTPDIYEDLKQHAHLFDFSDYPNNHPLYSETNKKVMGKFKDELNGEIAIEFVGLKSKMYSIKSTHSEKKRAKGVSTRIVRNKITHQDYFNCLQNLKTNHEEQKRIAQVNHQLYSITQNKISLSPFDDKRYILEDGIHSLAYGHCKLKKKANDLKSAEPLFSSCVDFSVY